MNPSKGFTTTTHQSTMPGISSEQIDPCLTSPGGRKRRRDLDIINLTHHYIRPIPSSLHHPNSSFCSDCPEPKDNGEFSNRPRYLPRKRRVLQQPQFHPQHTQPWSDGLSSSPQVNATYTKLLTPNIYAPAASSLSSPPVSPKTLVPISYPHHQSPCTSVSSLRPCHICHRRPTTREVLNAYADCDLCGERACYICLRQCDAFDCPGLVGGLRETHVLRDAPNMLPEDMNDGPTGHEARSPRKMCSRCAVEAITETGIEVVRCLECVRGHLSHWQVVHPGQLR